MANLNVVTKSLCLLNTAYPDSSVISAYLRRLFHKFTATFSTKDNQLSDRPSVTPHVQVRVLGYFEIKPHQSVPFCPS